MDAQRAVVLPPRRVNLKHGAMWQARHLRPIDEVVPNGHDMIESTNACHHYDQLAPAVK